MCEVTEVWMIELLYWYFFLFSNDSSLYQKKLVLLAFCCEIKVDWMTDWCPFISPNFNLPNPKSPMVRVRVKVRAMVRVIWVRVRVRTVRFKIRLHNETLTHTLVQWAYIPAIVGLSCRHWCQQREMHSTANDCNVSGPVMIPISGRWPFITSHFRSSLFTTNVLQNCQ